MFRKMCETVVKHQFIFFVSFFGMIAMLGLSMFRFITENFWEPSLENRYGFTILIIFVSAFLAIEIIAFMQDFLTAKKIVAKNKETSEGGNTLQ